MQKVILAGMIAASALAQTDPDTSKFLRWAAKFNKETKDRSEFNMRLGNWKQADAEIQRLNANSSSARFAHNPTSADTEEEFGRKLNKAGQRTGQFKEGPANKDRNLQSISAQDWSQPNSVRDQGACGSCVAFAAISVLENTRLIGTVLDKDSNPAVKEDMSEQHLVSCGVADNWTGVFGCSGAYGAQYYFEMIKQEGWMLESDFPYTSGTSSSDETAKCATSYDSTKAQYSVVSYNDMLAEEYFSADLTRAQELEEAIQNGPFSITVNAGQSGWRYYTGGILKGSDCGYSNTDHEISAQGLQIGNGINDGSQTTSCEEARVDKFGRIRCKRGLTPNVSTQECCRTTQSGTVGTGNVLKVQNSWGTGWGEDGFVYMNMEAGYGPCGINLSIGTVEVMSQE